MIKENILQNKTYEFSLQMIKLHKLLVTSREFIIARQILRCGTSIGANVEEAIGGFSKKDFASKLSIAYKESRETKYWIKLLRDSNYITTKLASKLIASIDEISAIIYRSINTVQNKNL